MKVLECVLIVLSLEIVLKDPDIFGRPRSLPQTSTGLHATIEAGLILTICISQTYPNLHQVK